jgi:hypothetical protein
VAKEPGHRGERDISRKTIACGNAGRFRCTRCYSCAFYQCKVHTRLRVQRAPGVPHALQGRKIYAQLGRIARRDREVASDRYKCATLSRHTPRISRSMTIFARERCDAQFRLRHSGARASANPESRDSGFDASHRPGMTASGIFRRALAYNASSTAFAISAVPLLPPNSIGLIPAA